MCFIGMTVQCVTCSLQKVFFPSLYEQKFSVVEQEKIDKFMLELDGTENKCRCLTLLTTHTFTGSANKQSFRWG